jgi:hypothetical protein
MSLMSSVTVPTTTAILSLNHEDKYRCCVLKDIDLLLGAEVSNEAGEGERGSVHSGSNESSQHSLCELRVSSSCEESEELHA